MCIFIFNTSDCTIFRVSPVVVEMHCQFDTIMPPYGNNIGTKPILLLQGGYKIKSIFFFVYLYKVV